ncbi:MAG: sugar ABC transporter permease [Chloroflexi bacterium]|nr:sugar ABC transporter permease [Chloroflexota bacterium]
MTEKGIRLSLSQGFARRASRRSAKDFFKGNLTYILFVLPAFTIYTILTIIPLVNTVIYSFTNFNGLSPNYEFVGIGNYLRAFSTRNAATAFGNSITYALVVPILITLLALPLALLLDSQMKTRNIQRAIFFFPSVISSLFLGFIWNFILSPSNQGLINSLLLSAGQQKLLLLADPRAAMVLLILVSVWASTGWHACIYLANLQVIDRTFYEAADIDGANGWQKFRFITLPNLAPAMTVSVMFLLIGSLKAFDLPFALTNGGPGYATTMITQTIINEGVNSNRVGFASAMSVLFLLLIGVVTAFQVGILGRREEKLT